MQLDIAKTFKGHVLHGHAKATQISQGSISLLPITFAFSEERAGATRPEHAYVCCLTLKYEVQRASIQTDLLGPVKLHGSLLNKVPVPHSKHFK